MWRGLPLLASSSAQGTVLPQGWAASAASAASALSSWLSLSLSASVLPLLDHSSMRWIYFINHLQFSRQKTQTFSWPDSLPQLLPHVSKNLRKTILSVSPSLFLLGHDKSNSPHFPVFSFCLNCFCCYSNSPRANRPGRTSCFHLLTSHWFSVLFPWKATMSLAFFPHPSPSLNL